MNIIYSDDIITIEDLMIDQTIGRPKINFKIAKLALYFDVSGGRDSKSYYGNNRDEPETQKNEEDEGHKEFWTLFQEEGNSLRYISFAEM